MGNPCIFKSVLCWLPQKAKQGGEREKKEVGEQDSRVELPDGRGNTVGAMAPPCLPETFGGTSLC